MTSILVMRDVPFMCAAPGLEALSSQSERFKLAGHGSRLAPLVAIRKKGMGHGSMGRFGTTTSMGRNTNQSHSALGYRRYAPRNLVLEELEKDAGKTRKGLWADPQPVPPWEWRKRSR